MVRDCEIDEPGNDDEVHDAIAIKESFIQFFFILSEAATFSAHFLGEIANACYKVGILFIHLLHFGTGIRKFIF